MAQGAGTNEESPRLEVKSSKLEGSRATLERGRYIHVFEYEPPEGEDFPITRGRLFAVVDLLAGAKVDPALAGKLIWSTLTGSYYDPSEEIPIRALEEAVYAARDRLQDLSDGATFNILAVSVAGDVAYMARVGDSVLYLRRGAEVREPLAGEEAISISSQILEPDDVLIAGSPVFGKNFSAGTLPATDFLIKQFGEGATIPGFAAILLSILPTVEAREEAVKKSTFARAFPKLARKLTRTSLGVLATLKSVNTAAVVGVKEKIISAFTQRLSHGQELAKARKEMDRPSIEDLEVPTAPMPEEAQSADALEPEEINLAAVDKESVGEQTSEESDKHEETETPEMEMAASEADEEEPAPEKVSKPRRKIQLTFLSNKRLLSQVTVLVILLLIASISFTTWRRSQEARAAELERLLIETEQKLTEAEGLIDISNEGAIQFLNESLVNLDRAEAFASKAAAGTISSLRDQADRLYNAIEKITPVTDENVIYDLNLAVAGAQGTALTGNGSILYASDATSGSILAVTTSDVSKTSKLAEGKISQPKDITWEQNFLYALTDTAVYRYNFSDKSVDEPISYEGINKARGISTYLGNIYLMVPEQDQIYKFWNLEAGYSRAVAWIKEAVDLGGSTDLAIDGDLWVAGAGENGVMRLTAGAVGSFSVANLSTPLKQVSKIHTQINFKNIYILDVGNSRIVVLDKSGNFVKQIKGDPAALAGDLWVSSNEENLYFLSGSKIYRIGL